MFIIYDSVHSLFVVVGWLWNGRHGWPRDETPATILHLFKRACVAILKILIISTDMCHPIPLDKCAYSLKI